MLDYASESPKTRQLTIKMRAWCSEVFRDKVIHEIQEDFLHVFEMDQPPAKSAIFKMVKKIQCEGTVMNLNKKSEYRYSHSERKILRTPEVIAQVRKSVEQSPKRSTRNVAKLSGHPILQTLAPRFLSVGLSQGQSV